jgi:predicted ester cyclase
MTQAEENQALVRRLIEIVNAGRLEALDEVGDAQFAEQARRWIGPFRSAFPDFRMEVREVVSEGDEVIGHFKCSGTQLGEWRGIPASGQRFEDVDETYVFRVEGGQLSAAIAADEDDLTRMRQLGI